MVSSSHEHAKVVSSSNDVNLPFGTDWPQRLQRIFPCLACPSCHGDLAKQTSSVLCTRCRKSYPINNGKIYFIEPIHTQDRLDTIKTRLKNYLGAAYYTVGVRVLAPVFPFNYKRAIQGRVDPQVQLVVDLGCGNYRVDDDIVTLDASDYDAVDIVADLESLPFKDGCIDALCSCGVLEHVPQIETAVAEMVRCTKLEGISLHLIPFLFPFHASPHDYTRLTHAGVARLFSGWSMVEQRNTAGPVTLFLICFIEFISVLLSFGVLWLKAVIYLFCCLVLFPIKYLDAPFISRASFIGLAPTILTVVRKA